MHDITNCEGKIVKQNFFLTEGNQIDFDDNLKSTKVFKKSFNKYNVKLNINTHHIFRGTAFSLIGYSKKNSRFSNS